MNELFTLIFKNNVLTTFLIIAVIIFRMAFFRKIPKWVMCFLWALVAIKLLIPFSVESDLSLIPTQKIEKIEYIAEENVFQNDNEYEETSMENKTVDAIDVASLVWLSGVSALILYGVSGYVFLKRKTRVFHLQEDGVRRCESISSPFVLGIFKPKIYMPFGLSEKTEKYVISHEKIHIKRFDYIKKIISFVILSINWFNPFVWVFFVFVCNDIEYACDERVIKNLCEEERKEYAYSLLECTSKRNVITAVPVAFGEVSVKSRVKNTVSYKKSSFIKIIGCFLFSAFLVVSFMTVPKAERISIGNSSEETEFEGATEETERSDEEETPNEDFTTYKPPVRSSGYNNTTKTYVYNSDAPSNAARNNVNYPTVKYPTVNYPTVTVNFPTVSTPELKRDPTLYAKNYHLGNSSNYGYSNSFYSGLKSVYTHSNQKVIKIW